MKVLAVMGSPRKNGNSVGITREIETRLRQSGPVEFEYLFLTDTGLDFCLGCHACVMHGEDRCPHHEARRPIEEKMAAADGVIFVSSLHNLHITARMKNFIDHMTHRVHRPFYHQKPAMIFLIRGELFSGARKYLRQMAKAWGFSVVCELGVAELETVKPKAREGAIRKIHAAADRFLAVVKTGNIPSPRLPDLFWFRMWQVTSEYNPVDQAYWQEKGWYGKSYYYETRVGFFANLLAATGGKIVRFMMDKVFGDSKK